MENRYLRMLFEMGVHSIQKDKLPANLRRRYEPYVDSRDWLKSVRMIFGPLFHTGSDEDFLDYLEKANDISGKYRNIARETAEQREKLPDELAQRDKDSFVSYLNYGPYYYYAEDAADWMGPGSVFAADLEKLSPDPNPDFSATLLYGKKILPKWTLRSNPWLYMGKEQKQLYLAWRQRAKTGVYPEIFGGYLLLYLYELFARPVLRGQEADWLKELVQVISKSSLKEDPFRADLLYWTAAYLQEHNLNMACLSAWPADQLSESEAHLLLGTQCVSLFPEVPANVMYVTTKKKKAENVEKKFPGLMDRLLPLAIRQTLEAIYEKGELSPLYTKDSFAWTINQDSRHVPVSHQQNREREIRILVADDARAVAWLKELIRETELWVRKKGKISKIKESSLTPLEKAAVARACERGLEAWRMEKNRREARSVQLDTSVIDRLRQESDAVRESLNTEEEKSEPAAVQITDAPDIAPFLSSLTNVQKEVLKIVQEADPAPALEALAQREYSMPDFLIDSVNTPFEEQFGDLLIEAFAGPVHIQSVYLPAVAAFLKEGS